MVASQVTRFPEEMPLQGKDLNRVLDWLLGNNGAQRKWIGWDGALIDPITGAAISANGYSDIIQNTAGHHTSIRKATRTTDLAGDQAFAVDDAFITMGVEGRWYNAAGSNSTNLAHSGTNNFLKTDGGLWIAKSLGVGTSPVALSDGYLLLSGNPRWLSGGAKFIELDHAATADRVVLFQDLAGTVCLLGVANAGGHLLFVDGTYDIGAIGATRPRSLFLSADMNAAGSVVVGTTLNLNASVGTATQVAHGGTPAGWGPVVGGDITDGTITAAKLAAQPAARAFHSVNQSITSGAVPAAALDSERFDTDTIHDLVTNNSRLTCKTAGRYQITAQGTFVGNATGIRLMRILLNATDIIAEGTWANQGAGQNVDMSLSTLWDMAVNDYVEMIVFQNSGVGLNLLAVPKYGPELMMARVG